MNIKGVLFVAGLLVALPCAQASASLQFDQNVTAIFGSGNADTNWTTNDSNDNAFGAVLGLRAKVRYNLAGNPENTFNSNGDGTYSHATGAHVPGRARWNFEWSIDGGTAFLNDLTYVLEIDTNSGWGTNFVSLGDVINLGFADHSIGTSATLNGQGTEAANSGDYANLIDSNQIAQNSWTQHWFDGSFDPNVDGRYDFRLTAYSGANQITQSRITVITGFGAVPEPGSIAIWSMFGLAAGLVSFRRRKATK